MNWNKRDVLPPLSKDETDSGKVDHGLSKQLLFKHESGKISTGKAILFNGKVEHFFPGDFDRIGHSPESKNPDSKFYDPIIGWIVCPTPEEIHGMLLTMESNGESI